MGAYEMTEILLGVLIFCLGAFMTLCPKLATKKALREDPSAVAKVRKSGICEMIVGILLIVIFFM